MSVCLSVRPSVRVSVCGKHDCTYASITHTLVGIGNGIYKIRGSLSRLVDIKVLESGASDNHVLCGSEGYQSEAIVARLLI